MATFNVPMLGTEIKPVPQTSLGDMLNIARGAQQYQQAQQINPLELQAKQQATRTGEIQLGVAEQRTKNAAICKRSLLTLIIFKPMGALTLTRSTRLCQPLPH